MLEQLSKVFEKWASLPYAKMLVIAFAVICWIQHLKLEKAEIRIDFKDQEYKKVVRESDSVQRMLYIEKLLAVEDCNKRMESILNDRIKELEAAKNDMNILKRNSQVINEELQKTMKHARE